MAEFDEVGRTIENFASEDATVVIGTVLDPDMQDEVKVTVVATGLNRAVVGSRCVATRRLQQRASRAASARAVDHTQGKRDGTTGMLVDGCLRAAATPSFAGSLRAVAVARTRCRRPPRSFEHYLDIPAFLRRQAD
jgi:cell division protein FtsZ